MSGSTLTRTIAKNAEDATRIAYRFWRPADTDRIQAAFNDPMQRPDLAAPRSNAQWEWEFDPHGGGSPPYVVAEYDERLIGTQGYIPIELLADGRLVLSGKDEDTWVHSGHRGQGVLDGMYRVLLQRAGMDGAAVLWGMTATAVRPLLRNGYRRVCPFERMRMTFNPPTIRGAWRGMQDRRALRRERAAVRSAGLELCEITRPPEDLEEFSIRFARRCGGIMVHWSARYMNWRVFENPYRRHTCLAALHRNRIVALAVLKWDRDIRNETVGQLSELIVAPDNESDAEPVLGWMVGECIEQFRGAGCVAVEARAAGGHAFNRLLRSVLERRGFARLEARQSSTFLVLPLDGDDARWLDPSRWRLSEIMREY